MTTLLIAAVVVAGRQRRSVGASEDRVVLPAPATAAAPAVPDPREFAGADQCASCHRSQFASWQRSTHGTAGGAPGQVRVIAPFDGTPIRFRDAVVIPAVTGGAYTFTVRQEGRRDRVYRADGVIGGGHLVGGGTQGFVSKFSDGTWRFLPFDYSRQGKTWFCNTGLRANAGWVRVTSELSLAACGDWPPARVLGDEPRFTNCQGCHGSRIDLAYDTTVHRWETRIATLAIDCESCHGPAQRHVELARAGTLGRSADIGVPSLATLDKDGSLEVCFRCHALKNQVAKHYAPGASLRSFYALSLAQLGDRPFFPDGRTRTFAYQEGHRFSPCYFAGGMTCTSCHDPHSQGYRDVTGRSISDRFDDRQCTSCHGSKRDAAAIGAHTKHAPSSPGSRCVACHMPYLQQPEIGTAIPYARSDHTISIPRPAYDSSLGIVGACRGCHTDRSTAALEAQTRAWWGTLKPHDSTIEALARMTGRQDRREAARLVLDARARNSAALYAGLASFVETYLAADLGELEDDVAARLRALSTHSDPDIRATALASLHYARGEDPRVRRFLAEQLASFGTAEQALRGRWTLVLGYLGDRLRAKGDAAGASATYRKALEISPRDQRVLLNLGLAYADAGDLDAAVASYRSSLAVDAQQPLALVNLGITLEARGDTAGAGEAYRRAIAIAPNDPLAYFNLGNVHLRRGDVRGAIPYYARAVELDPSLALAHFYLARAYTQSGEYARALAAVRDGLEFDSTNADARELETTLKNAVRR